ncbi:MAG: HIRAN domain-containing protein [Cyclobacteriaceae bacterium]|nr:HIRAN domain-containing protein [Cyclobacteriaceae bacterium HetDA_MAG_MS6]
MAKIIKLPSVFLIDTKVVGVSKQNADGSERQDIIKGSVEEDDKIVLEPEPSNIYDPNAVKVLTQEGKQIGYLNQDHALQVSKAIDNDVKVHCKVSWKSGEKYVGVGLRIELEN